MAMQSSASVIAQQHLNALKKVDDSELTVDQRIQIGMLAAQVELSDRLRGIEKTLDSWDTSSGL
ncbi:hypothetical protein [Salinifilum ghardaiensis]